MVHTPPERALTWPLALAARTPGLAAARLPALGDRPALQVIAALGAPGVSVPAARAAEALAPLADALDALCARADGPPELPVATLWLSYDAARAAADPRPFADARPLGDRCPAAWLAPHAAARVLDEGTGGERLRFGARRDLARLRAGDVAPGPRVSARLRSGTSRAAFVRAVGAIREQIAGGDVYLVNLARRVSVRPEGPLADYLAQRVIAARAPRALVANTAACTVAGMSMELALRWDRREGVAWTAPIKGTRPRRADPAEDRAEALRLRDDPKERAENAMAVDVHRNDLSRVATRVTAPGLFEVEPHAFVHHLVSRVRAEVPRGVGALEMLRAVLPVGSVTGAPKLAAMDSIARLEPTRRGLYTGVYGHVFGDGSVELTVAIRTLVAVGRSVTYGVGGGVVWDSDPACEWDELGWKTLAIR